MHVIAMFIIVFIMTLGIKLLTSSKNLEALIHDLWPLPIQHVIMTSSFQDKDSLNGKNSYNHNFDGKYCTCARPYPDPDDEVGIKRGSM